MPDDLVRTATELTVVPFVPEITLRLAGDLFGLWESTGCEPPPFWAFPWAGGQGLARYVLDHPDVVSGRVVLDIASGSGLVAIAAGKAGARRVIATDIDASALAAIALNAADNQVAVEAQVLDLTAGSGVDDDVDVVLAADIFYDRSVAPYALTFLRSAVEAGADVRLADPGRAFLPRDSLTGIERYEIPVIRALEDADTKTVTVYEVST
jgi:predicted nicotinamide N-methyase